MDSEDVVFAYVHIPAPLVRERVRHGVGALVLLVAFFVTPLAAAAQPAVKVARIGFLSSGSAAGGAAGAGGLGGRGLTALRQGLRDRGWVEGQNLERLPELAAELVRLKVDLIFAHAAPAALAAKRPGGNLTGLSGLAPELSGKRLELLRELLPDLRQVAVLVNPSNAMAALTLRETEEAARSLGVRLQIVETRRADELDAAFATFARGGSGALIVLQDPMLSNQARRIVTLMMKARLPSVFGETSWVQAGGLMAYSPSLVDIFRRAATYVDEILKGAKPADLPVEQPTKFELVINRASRES